MRACVRARTLHAGDGIFQLSKSVTSTLLMRKYYGFVLSLCRQVFIREFVSLMDKTIVSILEIKDAQLEDSGLYTCRTSNLQVKSLHVAVLNGEWVGGW